MCDKKLYEIRINLSSLHLDEHKLSNNLRRAGVKYV